MLFLKSIYIQGKKNIENFSESYGTTRQILFYENPGKMCLKVYEAYELWIRERSQSDCNLNYLGGSIIININKDRKPLKI